MAFPILSRVTPKDYIRIASAFVLVVFEALLRLSVAIFPSSLVDYVRYRVIGVFPRVFRGFKDEPDNEPLAGMRDIVDMVKHWNYPIESHVVTTPDGYLLALHRIPYSVHERQSLNENLPDRSSSGSPTSTSSRPRKPSLHRTKTVDQVIKEWRRLNSSSDSDSSADHSNHRNGMRHRTTRTQETADFEISEGIGSDEIHEIPDYDYTVYDYPNATKPVVVLWHGFMMCSEVWVCSKENSLAYMLVDAGYDVWMANNRGNKYSYKHVELSPTDERFWNFSLDNYASDVPVVVDYILRHTNQQSLIYVGFSQGTAQCFAALSVNQSLNRKIRLMIALAPTGKPFGLRDSLITSLVKLTPSLLYLMFGRRGIIMSAPFWQLSLSRDAFVNVLDKCMNLLFNWTNSNMTHSQKRIHYQHLYSFASVKSVVHWFQIIRSSKFQMFDDDPSFFDKLNSSHVPVRYPLANITTKIALFHGGSDTLSDLRWLLQKLPPPIFVLKVAKYEHLDCLWANTANTTIFPGVLGVIKLFGSTHPNGASIPPPVPHGSHLPSPSLIESVLKQGVFASNSVQLNSLYNRVGVYGRRGRSENGEITDDSSTFERDSNAGESFTPSFSASLSMPLSGKNMAPSIADIMYSDEMREEIINRLENTKGIDPAFTERPRAVPAGSLDGVAGSGYGKAQPLLVDGKNENINNIKLSPKGHGKGMVAHSQTRVASTSISPKKQRESFTTEESKSMKLTNGVNGDTKYENKETKTIVEAAVDGKSEDQNSNKEPTISSSFSTTRPPNTLPPIESSTPPQEPTSDTTTTSPKPKKKNKKKKKSKNQTNTAISNIQSIEYDSNPSVSPSPSDTSLSSLNSSQPANMESESKGTSKTGRIMLKSMSKSKSFIETD